MHDDILEVLQSLQSGGDDSHGGKILLVVDALDLLLATAGVNASFVGLGDMLMNLREVRYHLIQ